MKITIENLSKIYDNGKKAINDVNLEIGSGMFGLLGPNGAGKTSLMRILATLMSSTQGSIKINGLDIVKDRTEIRTMLGFLPQDFSAFPKLKTWEYLDYSASLAGINSKKERHKTVDELLEKVGLLEFRERYAKKLSGGMKRRLGIAQAIVGNPKILIVDEPTTGLDPEERIRFRNILSDMSRKEIIIILSTHIVGDISSTCNNMALLNKGEVAFSGSPDKLLKMTREHVFRIKAFDTDLERIKEMYPVISTIPSEDGWDVEVVADKLSEFSGEVIEPNLEHAYMYFMEYLVNEQY